MQEFICSECGYPAGHGDACDNPACLANPSLSEAHKQSLRDRAEAYARQRAEDEARRAFRASLRKQGFTTPF